MSPSSRWVGAALAPQSPLPLCHSKATTAFLSWRAPKTFALPNPSPQSYTHHCQVHAYSGKFIEQELLSTMPGKGCPSSEAMRTQHPHKPLHWRGSMARVKGGLCGQAGLVLWSHHLPVWRQTGALTTLCLCTVGVISISTT